MSAVLREGDSTSRGSPSDSPKAGEVEAQGEEPAVGQGLGVPVGHLLLDGRPGAADDDGGVRPGAVGGREDVPYEGRAPDCRT
jgi:hypothetical protein